MTKVIYKSEMEMVTIEITKNENTGKKLMLIEINDTSYERMIKNIFSMMWTLSLDLHHINSMMSSIYKVVIDEKITIKVLNKLVRESKLRTIKTNGENHWEINY